MKTIANIQTLRLVAVIVVAVCAVGLGQSQDPPIALTKQTDSPLEIVSMRRINPPAQASPEIAKRMTFFEVVLRNSSNVPIMAWAIRHGVSVASKTHHVCQASMGFAVPMIGGGETKVTQSNLRNHFNQTLTPTIDLVLFENGTFFGEDVCGYLKEYRTRLDERLAAYRTVSQRLDAEGVEKVNLWLTKELKRDVSLLLAPKKLTPPTSQSR